LEIVKVALDFGSAARPQGSLSIKAQRIMTSATRSFIGSGVVGPEFNLAMFEMDRDLKGFKIDSPVPHPDARVFKGILFCIITFATASNIDS
jgi:hypothetical protein